VVVARIADDGFGSRVHGRAAFDLGSLGLIGVVTGVVIFSMYAFVLQIRNFAPILFFNAVVLLIVGAVLWLRLAFPEDADPLVRFIRRVLEKPTVRSIEVAPSHFDRMPVQSAKLNVDGNDLGAPPSEYDVAQAIVAMKPSFLIIDFGSNAFMQTVLEYDRFILEKCEGSDHELYRAKGDFEGNEIIALMTAYLRNSQPSKQIVWEKVRG
jgi:hypothetical protein